MMTKQKIIKYSLLALMLVLVAPYPVSALASGDLITVNTYDSAMLQMIPAWISLAGAVLLLTLASRYMSGGKLAQPLALIGLGILIDGLVQLLAATISLGIFSASQPNLLVTWLGSLIFRISIVAGAIWIAKILGVLHLR